MLVFGIILFDSCQEKKKNEKEQDTLSTLSFRQKRTDPNTCSPCHAETVNDFLQTGKGRSFFTAEPSLAFENWESKPVSDSKNQLYYLPFQNKDGFWIKEFRLQGTDTVHKRTEKIDFFIGSGNQTRSYLFEENGYLYEMPITWYSKKKIWDLSPGYEDGKSFRFDREVGEECMDCHNSGFRIRPHSLNRYTEFGATLSCNNCHGDTRKHLEEMQKTGGKSKELHLISLKKMPLQVQMDVCRQCHLEGIKVRKEGAPHGDYEPGKLFSDFYEVFIPASGHSDFGFASHAERLQMSQCFKLSSGKMNCLTCHNPHAAIPAENKSAFFNGKCQSCHGQSAGHQKACSGMKSKDLTASNCVSCHLKRAGTNDIPHVNSTDHWIRKNPINTSSHKEKGLVFQHFAGEKFNPVDKGIALLKYAELFADTQKLMEVKAFLAQLPQEEKLNYYYLSKADWPTDFDTSTFQNASDPWILFRWANLKREKNLPYLSLLEKACQKAEDRVEFQYRLATAYEGTEKAIPQYEKVIFQQPNHVKALSNLGFHAIEKGDFAKAESLLARALVANPDYPLALENMARLQMEKGNFDASKKYLHCLMVLFPLETRYKAILVTIP